MRRRDGAGGNGNRVVIHHRTKLIGCLEALSPARIAHHEGEIILLYSCEGYLEGAFRTERDILLGICGRLVVLAGVNSEHGEIAGVAWPHPVVGFTAELAYRCRRCSYKTDVGIFFIYDYIVYVFIVERLDHGFAVRIGLVENPDERVGSCLEGFAFKACEVCGNIDHPFHEKYGKTRYRKLLSAVHCPVSVLEIVVLRRGKALDAAVSAVVVSYEEALVGDDLACTTAAELDNRVLEGGVVDVIYILCRKFAAHVLHDLAVHLLEEREQPHTFIGSGAGGEYKKCCQ